MYYWAGWKNERHTWATETPQERSTQQQAQTSARNSHVTEVWVTISLAEISRSSNWRSSWLTAIPLNQYAFTFHKGAFHDVLRLCYGWPPPHLASHCACGQAFTIGHVLSCPLEDIHPSVITSCETSQQTSKRGMHWRHCGTIFANSHRKSAWHENKHKWRGSQTGYLRKRFLGKPVWTVIFWCKVFLTPAPQLISPSRWQPFIASWSLLLVEE